MRKYREDILTNIKFINEKSKSISHDLESARNELALAKVEADQIKSQGKFISDQILTKINESFEKDLERIRKNSFSLIEFEKEKVILEVV